MEYFGHYRASTTGQTGCVKEFATLGQERALFPPQVIYFCDLCQKEHGFRYIKSHQVASPKQRENFTRFCATQGIEEEVDLH